MGLFLGIDLGTSYFKVGLFDERGELKGLGRVAVEKSFPAPDRCELSVDRFWSSLRQGLRDALAQAEATPNDIRALSYSSQASTFLLLDRQAQPLTPFIVWLDARGADLEPSLTAFSHTPRFQEVIGYRGVTDQTAVSKWRWFQRHEPSLWAQAHRVMTISDYFTFALTGEPLGDAGTASLLGIYDLMRRDWWPPALSAFEIDRKKLSTPLLPGLSCARTSAGAGNFLGLPAALPFAVGSLDHHAGAIGAGLGRFANTSITTGTVLAALALVDRVKAVPDCLHGPHVDGRNYYCLAFDPRGAARLEDYQRQFAPAHSLPELFAQAEALREDDIHGNSFRLLLEEITRTHRDLVQKISGFETAGNILATGGGTRSSLWLQLKADALNRPVITSRSPEQGCLGAAIFAAVASHHFSTFEEAQGAMIQAGETFLPALRRS